MLVLDTERMMYQVSCSSLGGVIIQLKYWETDEPWGLRGSY